MKIYNIKNIIPLVALSLLIIGCSKSESTFEDEMSTSDAYRNGNTLDLDAYYLQEDQMGRPAVNTVFVNSDSKDLFNTTIPSEQAVAFQNMFEANLTAISPAYANPGDTNALGLDAATFTSVLATDVLNVSLVGATTFFDGTNVLTGRALTDDVISVELLLIFGGEDGTENPTLSDDNVSANDANFLEDFPYLASPW